MQQIRGKFKLPENPTISAIHGFHVIGEGDDTKKVEEVMEIGKDGIVGIVKMPFIHSNGTMIIGVSETPEEGEGMYWLGLGRDGEVVSSIKASNVNDIVEID